MRHAFHVHVCFLRVTDGIILYISAPQRYTLQRLQFKGQAELSVDYPDGERSNVTITPGEETCMQRFLVNVPVICPPLFLVYNFV